MIRPVGRCVGRSPVSQHRDAHLYPNRSGGMGRSGRDGTSEILSELVEHHLTQALFYEIGIMRSPTRLVDARRDHEHAIIEALLSTRNADKSRDPEMHRRRSALKKRTWTRYEDSPLGPRSMTAYFVDVLFCFCRARTSRTIWLRTNAPSALITCPEVSFLRAGFGADRENPLEATD
jgi:hypothetical protein